MSRLGVCLLMVLILPGARALASEWHFGIGTGVASFGLNGEVGFPVAANPANMITGDGLQTNGQLVNVNLDNNDASDLVNSGRRLGVFASRGDWTVQGGYGMIALDGSAGLMDVEWERKQLELHVAYRFAQVDRQAYGVQLGLRQVQHEWDLSLRQPDDLSGPGGGLAAPISSIFEAGETTRMRRHLSENWTDIVVGATYGYAIAQDWTWSTLVSYGFGGSEGTWFARTQLNWRVLPNWTINTYLRYLKTEYGDKSDRQDSDFYYYNVSEPAVGLGVQYVW